MDLPLNGTLTLPPARTCSGGCALSKVTRPGPRYFDQESRTGGGGLTGRAIVPLAYFASSLANTGSDSGEPIEVVRVAVLDNSATGPCIDRPFSSNRRMGGVFLTATSAN